MRNTVWAVVCAISVSGNLIAQQDNSKPESKFNAETFSGLTLRSIGPALMSGRIADIAVDPVKPNTWYVAVGSGNLWKTVNAGTTWTPIFENYGPYSIGCVTIDPSNRHTIWVGSGEAVGGRHVGYGDGVYLSRDAGKSFTNVGLKHSEHIAKILVDPRNSQVIYVAAQGPLWSSGGERGLYKSSDSGGSWTQILAKGPYTGVTDIAFDPRNPDVLYAATHQRHRTVAALVNGGPESAIYKSFDGGASWTKLHNGLPSEDKGKISLAISSQRPDVVYATIELSGRTGGFWRSTDAGQSWTKMSDYISGGTGPHYYQEIWADPHRFDVVYQANVRLGRTEDGGKTWEDVSRPSKHVDNHAVVFHPHDPDFVLVGCDGGLYRSYDYCKTYQYCSNLPLTQFYKLSLDNDLPFYNIVGGTQDNNTQYGPSRTDNEHGIRNSDWITTIGGDGHDCAIDPKDPNIMYCESQRGFLRRYDRRTGESIDIRPQPAVAEEQLRFNWDSPILISPHSHTRLYFGSKKLHRSDDRGDSWTTISPDLSRNLDRFLLPMMGRIWSIDAVWDLFAMSQFGNITSIAESPLQEGLIYVGTDDGLIHVTEDGGETWRKIEKIYGIPEFAFVNDLKADLHNADTVYAVLDNHKTGDYRPYVVKSSDRGKSWTLITGDLPERHLVWRIVQDHVKTELLFVGTEFGLFFTLDCGQRWIKLTGNVPNVPFRDIEIQKRETDLVGASFGRSFYVFDDYSVLRHVTPESLSEREFQLFPIKDALQYIPRRVLGGAKGSQGDSFYTASNPPFGAIFTYHLRDSLKTQKQARAEQEAKVKEKGGDNPNPGFDQLKQEEREEDPAITFTVTDAQGEVVNRVTGPTSAGFHRVAWNLRYAAEGSPRGILVIPGAYTVTATMRVNDKVTTVGEPQTVNVTFLPKPTIPNQPPDEVLAFQKEATALHRRISGAVQLVDSVLTQLAEIKTAVRASSNGTAAMYDKSRSIELDLLGVRDKLSGDTTRIDRSQTAEIAIAARARIALNGLFASSYGPTKTHRAAFQAASQQYGEIRAVLTRLVDVELEELKKQLDDAGVPWTAGRKIP